MEKCELCGTNLKPKWLVKTGGERLCRDCYNDTTRCHDCGEQLPRKDTITIKGHTQCRTCMLKDELPIEVVFLRSSHGAAWAEEEVIAIGDLLYRDLSDRRSRRSVGVQPSLATPLKEVI